MWITKNYNQNTVTSLEFYDLTIHNQKISVSFFGEGTIYKSPTGPAGFKLMTSRFIDYTLTHCATMIGNKFGKDK